MKVRVKDGKFVWGWWGETNWWLLCWAIWISDRMPWFARKRLINWIAGQDVLSDFCQTDHVLKGWGIICFKW